MALDINRAFFDLTRGISPREKMKDAILEVMDNPYDMVNRKQMTFCLNGGISLENEKTFQIKKFAPVAQFKKFNCPTNEKPIGMFFTQYWAYGADSNHIISRPVLKYAFLDNDFEFACSGYLSKSQSSRHFTQRKPNVTCLIPKEGVTKKDILKTIDDLEPIFDEEKGMFDIEYGTQSSKYFKGIEKTFDVKKINVDRV